MSKKPSPEDGRDFSHKHQTPDVILPDGSHQAEREKLYEHIEKNLQVAKDFYQLISSFTNKDSQKKYGAL